MAKECQRETTSTAATARECIKLRSKKLASWVQFR